MDKKNLIAISVLVLILIGWYFSTPEKQETVTVKTDKEFYKEGETIVVTIKNDLDRDIVYGGQGGAETFLDGRWVMVERLWRCPCNFVCDESLHKRSLSGNSTVTVKWGQLMNICNVSETITEKAPGGRYRIRVDVWVENKKQDVYSNEFMIEGGANCSGLEEEECRENPRCVPLGLQTKEIVCDRYDICKYNITKFHFEECVEKMLFNENCTEIVKMTQSYPEGPPKECRCCCGEGQICVERPYPRR